MIPCVDLLSFIREGFHFLRGVVKDLQLNNLMMIAISVVLSSRFCLSEVSRSWLKKRTVNAFSHCLRAAKFKLEDAMNTYARMIRQSYDLQGGRFIIDDTMEHHTKLCKFIYGVSRHWDHVFRRNVSAKCLVFLYYSEGGVIKFPIGWRIYFKGGKKTKNDLALELIQEGMRRGFPCGVVLADRWYCVEPFVRELRWMGLRYVMEIKTTCHGTGDGKEAQERAEAEEMVPESSACLLRAKSAEGSGNWLSGRFGYKERREGVV